MEKNTIPKEFRKYIDEDLLTVTWENEGEKVNINFLYYCFI